MIIIGYQGIGKSILALRDNKFIDLESSNFYNNGERPDNWYVYYCNIANNLSEQGFNVFVSSHKVVRDRLKKYSNQNLICVYPSLYLKDEWIRKLQVRFQNDKSEKNYKALMNAIDKYEENITDLMNCGIFGVELVSMNYDLESLTLLANE